MKLYKAHGLGNDYLVLRHPTPISADLAARICHRTMGVGGDGIIELGPTVDGVTQVNIYNPDGSLAEKSGNGLRIGAWFLFDQEGAPHKLRMATHACQVQAHVFDASRIRMEMGRARFDGPQFERGLVDEALLGVAVNTVDVGNPHCVHFVDDWEAFDQRHDWRALGAALEVHPHFPNRTNVQFALVKAGGVEIRIWERGAGETSASGSSSCAVAAAAVRTGRLEAGPIPVWAEGGTLLVEVDDLGQQPPMREGVELVLEGPVAPVGWIHLDEHWPGFGN